MVFRANVTYGWLCGHRVVGCLGGRYERECGQQPGGGDPHEALTRGSTRAIVPTSSAPTSPVETKNVQPARRPATVDGNQRSNSTDTPSVRWPDIRTNPYAAERES